MYIARLAHRVLATDQSRHSRIKRTIGCSNSQVVKRLIFVMDLLFLTILLYVDVIQTQNRIGTHYHLPLQIMKMLPVNYNELILVLDGARRMKINLCPPYQTSRAEIQRVYLQLFHSNSKMIPSLLLISHKYGYKARIRSQSNVKRHNIYNGDSLSA